MKTTSMELLNAQRLLSKVIPNETITPLKILRTMLPKRLTLKALWNNQVVVIKIFKNQAARKELKAYKQLKRNHILFPDILLTGTASHGSFIIFKYLENELNDFKNWGEDRQKSVLKNIITLVASMHSKKLLQMDLHLGNFILYQKKLYVLDTSTIKYPLILKKEKKLLNLALFFKQLPVLMRKKFVPILLKHYLKLAPKNFQSFGYLLLQEKINQAIIVCDNNKRKHFFKKCQRNSTQFLKKKNIICQKALYNDALKTFLENMNKEIKRGILIKNGNTATVVVTQNKKFVIKRYNKILKLKRALHSWKFSNELIRLEFPTLNPIALIQKKNTTYFVSEYIRGATARDFFDDLSVTLDRRLRMISKIVQCLEMLYALQFCHGDLKDTNFIISHDAVYIIDLDGIKFHKNKKKFEYLFKKEIQRLLLNWQHDGVLQSLFLKKLKASIPTAF